MRVAVSGSHSTGKSTLIAAFLRICPEYAHEPEAYETLADDIELTPSGAPTPDGLRALLEYTISAVQEHSGQARVVFERSPVDYIAYAVASRTAWQPIEIRRFLSTNVPIVRASLQHLDLIAYLPLSTAGPVRPGRGEDRRFRRRVDASLKRALLDDAYNLFGDDQRARVVALPPAYESQLAELRRLVDAFDG